ncbi:glutamyl/glutaminyl-tRNA synthetase [Pullulanibacillus pueri]|nr:glutamyl/glutaminyl-tRNA synthetase [Pullulanibacillus pueri]
MDNILEVHLLNYQSSLISIMSEPMESYSLKDNVSSFTKKIIRDDFEKGIFDKLNAINPDYVVMDFTSDVAYGTLQIGSKYVTNNQPRLDHVEIPETGIPFTLKTNRSEYLQKWTESFNEFTRKLKESCPSTKVVVHAASFVSSYYEETYLLKSLQRNDVQSKNKLLRTLEGTITDNEVYFIDLTDRKFHSSEMHKWKLGYLHYETKYYNEFLLEFFKLIIWSNMR